MKNPLNTLFLGHPLCSEFLLLWYLITKSDSIADFYVMIFHKLLVIVPPYTSWFKYEMFKIFNTIFYCMVSQQKLVAHMQWPENIRNYTLLTQTSTFFIRSRYLGYICESGHLCIKKTLQLLLQSI